MGEGSEPQADVVAPVSFRERLQNFVLDLIPELRYRHIAIAFGAGGVMGIVLLLVC